MTACTRCGIDSKAELCRDCVDVLGAEARRYSVAERLSYLLQERDRLDEEIANLTNTVKPDRKRPRSVVPACGTESAYQRHRARGEQCPEGDLCKRAHADHERVARIRRQANTRKRDVA